MLSMIAQVKTNKTKENITKSNIIIIIEYSKFFQNITKSNIIIIIEYSKLFYDKQSKLNITLSYSDQV